MKTILKHLIFTIFFCFNTANAQTVLYVSPTSSGDESGDSWANAMTIHQAFESFERLESYTVRLRQGTYRISSTLTSSSFSISYELIGGYSGTGTTRDYENFPTIFDGLNQNQILELNNRESIIDGITFTNGNVSSDNNGGGAIYIRGDDNIIRNSRFTNNTSNTNRGAGAIYIGSGSSNAIIENCEFIDNRSLSNGGSQNGGGAIHNWATNTSITNTLFKDNHSDNDGGAVYTWGEDLRLTNLTFENNTSSARGGAIHVNSHNILIRKNTFSNNKADSNGGAINNSNNIISDKKSYIENSSFNGNEATRGGAVYNNNHLGLNISNSLFLSNTVSDIGGAIFNDDFIEITNSTFVRNTNTAFINSSNSNTNIYNSIFYTNSAKSGGYKSDINKERLNNNNQPDQNIRFNILEEYEDGTNNWRGINPLFVNNNSNFNLQASSSAINAGNNSLYNEISLTNVNSSDDLNDQQRLIGSAIDLGAYEHQTSLLTCITISLPANNANNVSIETNIEWNSINGADGYRISIGTTENGNEVLDSFDVGNVTTYNLPNNLEYNTTYYVSVVPYNAMGSAQNCNQFNFTTETEPIVIPLPNCTTISLPANNANNVSIETNIEWNSINGADGYRISIGTTENGNEILDSFDVGNVTTYNLPNNLEYNTTYYVSVIPYNATGSAQNCNQFNFTTETEPIVIPLPNCTTISLPANNANNVSIDTNIKWNSINDADGYRISIGTTENGNEVLDSFDVGNITTYNLPNNLDYNTTYYVYIVPYNATGSAQNCNQFNFTTETEPIVIPVPNCTTISLPANNANNVSIDTNIEWNSINNAEGYRISIGTTENGNEVLDSFDVGNITTYNLPNNLDYNTTYYVYIVPYNATESAQNCNQFNFTTETEPCLNIEAELNISKNNVTINMLNQSYNYEFNLNNTGWTNSNIFTNIPFGRNQIEVRTTNGCSKIFYFDIEEFYTFISPNNDGKNDEIDFSFLNNKDNAKIMIVDRFGKTIYEDNGENNFIWNGVNNNKTNIKSDSYWYYIEWNEPNSNSIMKLQGSILLKNN